MLLLARADNQAPVPTEPVLIGKVLREVASEHHNRFSDRSVVVDVKAQGLMADGGGRSSSWSQEIVLSRRTRLRPIANAGSRAAAAQLKALNICPSSSGPGFGDGLPLSGLADTGPSKSPMPLARKLVFSAPSIGAYRFY